eukprot:TRINITY_DN87972_c0_g1_i1.p1 TRINITY_DN87972_c0_g1~~TRINITY_DN87972_c0_g1_i1.p1  ORF type:complete len:434 (-),score=67.85 TRINITY_DN87972_c0_g1_i1:76-1377(-)
MVKHHAKGKSAPCECYPTAADGKVSLSSGARESCGKLLVLLCGVPGCGKDTIGRACAKEFLHGAAVSQDEYNGDAARTRTAIEALLSDGRSPIFILRNGPDAADRFPYVSAAKRNGYRVGAAWPSEISCSDMRRKAALYLAALAGCYGRLRDGGRTGHETLTAHDNIARPAQICQAFFQSFRAPSAPGEVDAILALPFLISDFAGIASNVLADDLESSLASLVAQLMKKGCLPDVVTSSMAGTFADTQAKLLPWAVLRCPANDLAEELLSWAHSEIQIAAADSSVQQWRPAEVPAPSKEETKRLQREVKIRAAMEHLVSPANIASCRLNGSTVTNCVWIMVEGTLCPAWPLSHFCGAPQLRKLGVAEWEILDAARVSASAHAPLQDGLAGVKVQVVPGSLAGDLMVSPSDALPEASLMKLGCPDPKRAQSDGA